MRGHLWIVGTLLLLPVGAGCDRVEALMSQANDMDADLDELGAFGDAPPADTAEAEPAPMATAAAPGEQPLAFRLQVGDRFPLTKTIDQQLTQVSSNGVVTSTSRLEMLLAISVEETTQDGRDRLGVQYSQVKYQHDLPGEKVAFDSTQPTGQLPLSVQAYAGLAGNSFSFWLGPDHRILDLVGFQGFLERCVAHVSPDQRQAVMTHLAATTGEEGLANFVDDSIGLLPTEIDLGGEKRAPRIGDTWSRQRQVVRPVPMHVSMRYLLKSIDERTAVIDVMGTIAPLTTYGGPNSAQTDPDLKLSLRGGYSMGSCMIDRKTGLPSDSRVEQYLDMVVNLPDGNSFEQRKQTVTTIRAFPAQSSPSQQQQQIVPVSGSMLPSNPAFETNHSAVVPAGGFPTQGR